MTAQSGSWQEKAALANARRSRAERIFATTRGHESRRADPDDAPPPVTLPRLAFLAKDDTAEIEREAREAAARVAVRKTIRAGRDALAAIDRAETFEAWMAIGKALCVGKQHALRVTGANAAWGRNYSRAFGGWMHEHGFGCLPKSTRSHAIELAEHAAEIRRWRDGLPDGRRRQLIHPQSVTRRWRASMASPDARAPADLKRDAAAAWRRFCACVDALPPELAADLWLIVQARITDA